MITKFRRQDNMCEPVVGDRSIVAVEVPKRTNESLNCDTASRRRYSNIDVSRGWPEGDGG